MSKKTKRFKLPLLARFHRHRFAALAIMCALVLVVSLPIAVYADQFDTQIQQLQSQNAQSESIVNSLAAQANSYQDAINVLQSQISALQGQINANLAEQASLQQQITATQNQLDHEKVVLGDTIQAIYVGGQLSTVEELASSKSLSDFVDAQTYRSAVQDQIQATMNQITQLQNSLKADKERVDLLLQQQQAQQNQLSIAQAQQASLLSYNEAQQAQYNQQIQATNAQISSLRAQQAAFYDSITGGGTRDYGTSGSFQFRNLSSEQSCGGGYTYCWAGFDQSVDDTWGLYLARECVHYAADRAALGVNLSSYLGSGNGYAWMWPSRLDGQIINGHRIVVDDNPEVGAIAIASRANIPPEGHAMYVESILPDGWVHVSQMNWDVQGHYSTMDVKDSGVVFIHFDE